MTVPALTTTEMQMLQNIRVKADELAHMVKEANASGFNVTFNITPPNAIALRIFRLPLAVSRVPKI